MSTAARSIATVVLWIAAALLVSPQPVRAQPDAPLTGKWQGKVMFPSTGERTNGDVVFEPDGRRGMFLKQPLIDVRRRDGTLTFTWGEGGGAVRCSLPWDADKESFRGECVASGGEAAAALEFIPLAQKATIESAAMSSSLFSAIKRSVTSFFL